MRSEKYIKICRKNKSWNQRKRNHCVECKRSEKYYMGWMWESFENPLWQYCMGQSWPGIVIPSENQDLKISSSTTTKL